MALFGKKLGDATEKVNKVLGGLEFANNLHELLAESDKNPGNVLVAMGQVMDKLNGLKQLEIPGVNLALMQDPAISGELNAIKAGLLDSTALDLDVAEQALFDFDFEELFVTGGETLLFDP